MTMVYEFEKSLKNRLLNLELDDYVEVIQLEKEYEELEETYAKAKAFDTFLLYNQHVEKYNNSDCHELERVFQRVMKEYMEVE